MLQNTARKFSFLKRGLYRRSYAKATTALPSRPKHAKPAVFMFPGQGSQIAGMGKDLAEKWSVAREVFEEADEALRINLSERMFSGSADDIKPTALAQPAIVAHGMAILQVLRSELGRDPIASTCAILGHSVGELTGFCAADGFSIGTAVKLAHQRGIYMQAAVPVTIPTGMFAFFPMNLTQAQSLQLEVTNRLPNRVIDIACVNSPKQIVLSGDKEALELASKLANEGFLGDKVKSTPLEVSAPFHSRYMTKSHSTFGKLLFELKTKIATVPIVSGFSGKPNRLVPNHLRDDFVPLTSGTVNFVACIEQAKNLLHSQPTPIPTPLWLEIGPKPVLTSFLNQTLPNPGTIVTLSNAEDVQKLLDNKPVLDILFPEGSPPAKKKRL